MILSESVQHRATFVAQQITSWAPAIVQRAENSTQWINRYPADKMYSNQYILSAA